MKLPKLLYVATEKVNGERDCLIADRELYTLFSSVGEVRTVGVYRLVETKVVASIVEVRKRRASK